MDIIEHVTIKRPVNSPKVETFRRGFEQMFDKTKLKV